MLEGQWIAVVAAEQAAVLLLPARTVDGLALFVLETGFDEHGSNGGAGSRPLTVTPQRGIDLTQNLGDVQATSLRLPPSACLAVGPAVGAALARAWQVGAVMLAAVQVGLATVYDMCKAADRGMVIEDVRLLEKRGGKSGTWVAEAPAT